MMGINIITANFSNGGRQSITRKLYQYDYGQKVSIRGLSLPSTFEVHISNDNNINTAEVYTGTKNEIEIPDKFLLSGKAIYMWLFLHNAENDGQTRYIITIPVEERPKPQAAVPVTDENTINQLLMAALQNPQQAKNSTGINIVTANFKNERNTITRKLYQYDYGQVINIKGLNLPKAFEVHISNSNKANTAQIYIGNNDQIEIPNKFLLSGEDIYLWIFLHSTATDGQTRYTITIPVQKKPKPESEEPTEVEQNTIDQLIAALEVNLNEMQQATEDAKTEMDQATAAAKEQMQLAIDKANDIVSKYPKIVEDYWYVYDVENQVWVNTQIKALAVDGVGIENIVYNNNYTITINLTDGTSYTTESIRGQKGDKGDTGATPNIKIQSTETLAPNQYANVTISGTSEEPKLTFRIPKGEKGDKGDTGAMPQISIGTVETLLPHRHGYVTQTGTAENPVLNFGLVKGETGQAGKTAYEYAVENGYSGNENDFSNALANLATLQEVDQAITEAMEDITGFEFQIVQNLPTAGEKGIIYLVPHSHGVEDIYDEYIWVTDRFEKIGSTDIDLSDYLQTNDIADWAKAATKPTYTAAEVGALPDDTAIPTKVSDLTDDSGHYTKPATGIPASDLADGVIPDVQINGTSIVEDGVADIPVAGDTVFGAVKVQTNGFYGIKYFNKNNDTYKFLVIQAAENSDVKKGILAYQPVVPFTQHIAAFYGLAKAAGHDEKNSTLPVGQYTDEAKSAIKTMLGVSEPSILIDDTATTGDMVHTWSADKIETELANAGTVQDVQVNGTSIVEDGVANIPIANNKLGAVFISANSAYGLKIGSIDGILQVVPATSTQIKTTANYIYPIPVKLQHQSTFYGLAKAAGDTTQSASSNAVGTYTDEAKAAIKSMLDVRDGDLSVGTVTTLPSTEDAAAEITGDYTAMTLNLSLPRGKSGVYIGAEAPTDQDISVWIDTSESSNPYVETLTGTDVTIVGSPNCRYMCGELYSLAITPPIAGTMDVMFTSGSTPTVLTVPSTVKFPEWCDPANLEANTIYEIYIMDGSFAGVSTWPV